MKFIYTFLLFVCNFAYCQNDPFDFDRLFDFSPSEHTVGLLSLGYDLESVDSLEFTHSYAKINAGLDIVIYFDSIWKSPLMISFLIQDQNVYYSFLNDVENCKKYSLIPVTEIENMTRSYLYDGVKHDGYVVFKSIISNDKLIRMIILMDSKFSSY